MTNAVAPAGTRGGTLETNAGIYDAFVAKIAAASLGKITGGGSIAIPGGIASFRFDRTAADTRRADPGRSAIRRPRDWAKVQSATFTTFSIVDPTATFGETCVKNGMPCTFTVAVTDNGEPGSTDTFTIPISGSPSEGGPAPQRQHPDPSVAGSLRSIGTGRGAYPRPGTVRGRITAIAKDGYCWSSSSLEGAPNTPMQPFKQLGKMLFAGKGTKA